VYNEVRINLGDLKVKKFFLANLVNYLVSSPALALYMFAAMYGFSIAMATESKAPLPKTERVVYAPKASPAWCEDSYVQCMVMGYFDFE
jgi:hypothetical protein